MLNNAIHTPETNLENCPENDRWKTFNKCGLHLIHLNINSVLPKIDELREIAKKTRATVIGLTETKLDATVLDGEVNIEGYELIRSDCKRHGGGVACYIKDNVAFRSRGGLSNEIENLFFDILLSKTNPILVGIIYRPPNQSRFLERLTSAITNINDFDNQEVYILGEENRKWGFQDKMTTFCHINRFSPPSSFLQSSLKLNHHLSTYQICKIIQLALM